MASSGYLIVEPGDDIRPAVVPQWTPGLVDYEHHHAYSGLIARPGLKTRLQALSIFGRSMAKLLLKRAIKYELIPFDIRRDKSLAGRARFIVADEAQPFGKRGGHSCIAIGIIVRAVKP